MSRQGEYGLPPGTFSTDFPCLLRCNRCGALYGFRDMEPKGDRCLVIRGVDSHICDGIIVPWFAPHGSEPK